MCADGAGAFRWKGEAVRYRDGVFEKGRLKTGKRFCRRFSDDLGSEVEGGVDEAFGVVFLRLVEDLVCAAVFDEFSVLHDGDVVTDSADNGEVVADEDVGQSVFGLESAQQFDDFDLDGAVEGGGGFVEEDELGPQDEGAGDGDALALSA